MADEVAPKTTKAGDGFTAPIADPGDGQLPEHIHEDTLMAKGIDPDTKQMVTVSLSVMKAKYGEAKGLKLYQKIARAGGFFDPMSEAVGSSYSPDISLEGIDPKVRTRIDAILKEA